MKAIVLRDLGAADNLRIEELPDPSPGPGEAVVRVKAAALNHRDVWIWKGMYAGIKLPVVPGSDAAGVVQAVGPGVDPAWVGRDVVVNPSLDWGDDPRCFGSKFRILGLPDDGSYAELLRVPAVNLAPKPASLDWHEAASIPLAGLTAYRAVVTKGQVQHGDTVLVTGIGGGVATFALAIALHLGAKVVVTSGDDDKLARAAKLGAHGGVNYKAADSTKRILELCDGKGPDVVIDSAGGAAFSQAVEVLKPGGRLVNFGATTGPVEKLEVRRVFWKQLSLLGTTMGSPEEFAAMVRLYSEAGLKPVVDRVFPLAQAPDAHRRMDSAGQFGKIVLHVQD